jgi:uracil permease
MSNAILDVNEKPSGGQLITLSFQHMFAMFGSTILVPQLVGLSPAIALLTSGIATIIFLIITRFQVPAYLGSSFAFITPIIIATNGKTDPGNAMIGAMFVGLVYGVVSLIIWKSGYKWIMKLLPAIVVGPVIMVIGLGLAGVAVDMAMNIPIEGTDLKEYSFLHFSAALVTLFTAIFCTIYFKNILSTMPILIGLVVGYIYSIIIGIVNFEPIREAKMFALPDFLIPGIHYEFIVTPKILLVMVPIVIVTISEHIGHQLVLGKVVILKNLGYIDHYSVMA